MRMWFLVLAGLMLALVGCGGAEFSVAGSPEDTAPGDAAVPDGKEAAVEVGDEKLPEASPEADAADAPIDVAEDVAQDVVTEADAAAEDVVSEAEASPEADATDAPIDVAEDVAQDVHEAGDAATDAPVDTGLLPPCGIVPQQGWWICYKLDHQSQPLAFVGLSGGIVPSGQSIENYWSSPLIGAANTKCIAPSNLLDYVLCPLGNLENVGYVQFTAGLHPNTTDGFIAGTLSCGLEPDSCSGEAYVYHDGSQAGSMQNGQTNGVLGTIQHFTPPGRYDLYFSVQ